MSKRDEARIEEMRTLWLATWVAYTTGKITGARMRKASALRGADNLTALRALSRCHL